MKMKLPLGLALGAVLLLACGSQRALGQAVITLDEHGTPFSAPSTIAPDPLNGGVMTVAYILPFLATPGDLEITEPPVGTTSPPSDLLRWEPQANQTLLFVYSDVLATSDPANDPADVGIPAQLQTNLAMAVEIGWPPPAAYTDAANGVAYTPAAGAPGSVPGAGFTYDFISDVPEPGVLCLAPALAGLLMRRR